MKPTQEQVIAWAREAGLSAVYAVIAEHDDGTQTVVDHRPFLERFAALVAAVEREEEEVPAVTGTDPVAEEADATQAEDDALFEASMKKSQIRGAK